MSLRWMTWACASLALSGAARGAGQEAPTNSLPNPYTTTVSWQQFPALMPIGAAAAIAVDSDGETLWVADRCGQNSCIGSERPMVFHLDTRGRVIDSFGAGMLVAPHGLFVDRDGNLWITDMGNDAQRKRGSVIIKFDRRGKVLLTLGTPGEPGDGPDHFIQPCAVAVAPSGDVFVADSHSAEPTDAVPRVHGRIVKFSAQGRFLKEWGRPGSGPGELRIPHAMAFDSTGRLFVADRGNNRIQIFDQDGTYLAEWKQFSRPSGLYIRDDVLYVSDSESNTSNHPGGWLRGVRIGSARTGVVRYFVPWLPTPNPDAVPSGMEGVTADRHGNIFGANVYLRDFFPGGPWGEIRRFSRR